LNPRHAHCRVVYKEIERRLQAVVAEVCGVADTSTVLVRPCPDSKFGDYQTNALMSLARERKTNPRQLAEQVRAKLHLADICSKVDVAGAGYLNFTLSPQGMAACLGSAHAGKHLFFEPASRPQTIVVDYSSPNVAKAMHVGHIRSTILGHSLANVLRLLGHNVITDNHIGDWGTQFGKLILGWKREINRAALMANPLAEMERLYKKVNAEFEKDEAVKAEARQELVKLQAGDAENLAIWREMIDLSLMEFNKTYQRLGVSFDHTLGESFYNPRLKQVAEGLRDSGLARESNGALVVFFDDLPELKENPVIIQKSDGAANYATTDLATLEYRMAEWKPDQIIYVTDSRQQLHFKQFFTVFRRWKPEAASVGLHHVWFGMILGPDGTPFKTRTGENIKLDDLLAEAEERALAVVTEKNPEMELEERQRVARVIGLGAIKYSDLLPNRQSDYMFSWDKMLAFSGNTAPYLLYAYARIQSIFRKAAESPGEPMAADFNYEDDAEKALARHLLNFSFSLDAVAAEFRPNYLCNYLFELASFYARFHENCPVLKSEGLTRANRLALCELAARVLRQGLESLGIETIERM